MSVQKTVEQASAAAALSVQALLKDGLASEKLSQGQIQTAYHWYSVLDQASAMLTFAKDPAERSSLEGQLASAEASLERLLREASR